MNPRRLNRACGVVLVALSLVALGTVALGYVLHLPRETDEGTAAHIFQLSILALIPVGVMYLATANWSARPGPLRPLVLTAVALALAFVGLYFLEH